MPLFFQEKHNIYEAIREVGTKTLKLFEAGKTEELAKQHYTENCIIVVPGQATGKGHEAAKKFYDDMIKNGGASATIEPLLGLENAGITHTVMWFRFWIQRANSDECICCYQGPQSMTC